MKNFVIGKKLHESSAILIDAILFWKEFESEIETENTIPVIIIKRRRVDNNYMNGNDLFKLFKRVFIDGYIKNRFTYNEIETIGVEKFNTDCNNWWEELSKKIIINNYNIEIQKY